MSNLLKLTPENYYTKEANMQYVSVSQYKEFNGTTGKWVVKHTLWRSSVEKLRK